MPDCLPAKEKQEGQVVLVILLVISVMLVVGLSVVSRSITDIKISQQSSEAARALWVAQAGLEKALKVNLSIGASTPEELGGVKYLVTKTGFGERSEIVFPQEMKLRAGQSSALWLVDHDEKTKEVKDSGYEGTQLTFYWGDQGATGGTTPALEATLIYKNAAGDFVAQRYAFETYPGRSLSTSFTDVSTNSCPALAGKNFSFCSDAISLPAAPAVPYLMQVKMLFNTASQPFGVKGNADFPLQGNCLESTATIEESGITRKLKQCESWSMLPTIFDYTLFSGGDIQ